MTRKNHLVQFQSKDEAKMKREAHRPRVLNDLQVQILETRITLSRDLGFSLTNLSDGWGISIATLHRYKSPEYREASVRHSKKTYLSYRKSLIQGVCYRCREDLEFHRRCEECTVLLHAGSLFGDTLDGKNCTGCVDSKERQLNRMYEELIA